MYFFPSVVQWLFIRSLKQKHQTQTWHLRKIKMFNCFQQQQQTQNICKNRQSEFQVHTIQLGHISSQLLIWIKASFHRKFTVRREKAVCFSCCSHLPAENCDECYQYIVFQFKKWENYLFLLLRQKQSAESIQVPNTHIRWSRDVQAVKKRTLMSECEQTREDQQAVVNHGIHKVLREEHPVWTHSTSCSTSSVNLCVCVLEPAFSKKYISQNSHRHCRKHFKDTWTEKGSGSDQDIEINPALDGPNCPMWAPPTVSL